MVSGVPVLVGVLGVVVWDLCFWFSWPDRSCAFVCGVCGLGLLFENYIVDASIFYKKQFPRYMNLDLAALLMPFWGVGVWLVFMVLS